ncbi:hypothetical protein DYU05_16885 [Mucilaginibacter terrenus]|uniref:Uncharacterized protein n=1 Tax=Mucilaginibacter terrenus TaxID=2482727 RepID=A0A3E2NMR4_9SPHI|nr:hypothetical protein DYU05_16885 [Mucilaginibacter terrenus]
MQTLSAQVKTTVISKNAIPASIKYSGHVINAVNFTDEAGRHLVITTETGEKQAKSGEESYREAALYAYGYTLNKGAYHLDWKVQDFVMNAR